MKLASIFTYQFNSINILHLIHEFWQHFSFLVRHLLVRSACNWIGTLYLWIRSQSWRIYRRCLCRWCGLKKVFSWIRRLSICSNINWFCELHCFTPNCFACINLLIYLVSSGPFNLKIQSNMDPFSAASLVWSWQASHFICRVKLRMRQLWSVPVPNRRKKLKIKVSKALDLQATGYSRNAWATTSALSTQSVT